MSNLMESGKVKNERLWLSQNLTFATELAYTILPRASRSTEGSITLESKTLQVVEANLEKTFSTSGLRSYRSQKVTATLKLDQRGFSRH